MGSFQENNNVHLRKLKVRPGQLINLVDAKGEVTLDRPIDIGTLLTQVVSMKK